MQGCNNLLLIDHKRHHENLSDVERKQTKIEKKINIKTTTPQYRE